MLSKIHSPFISNDTGRLCHVRTRVNLQTTKPFSPFFPYPNLMHVHAYVHQVISFSWKQKKFGYMIRFVPSISIYLMWRYPARHLLRGTNFTISRILCWSERTAHRFWSSKVVKRPTDLFPKMCYWHVFLARGASVKLIFYACNASKTCKKTCTPKMDFFILFEYMFWTCFRCVTCIKNEIYACSSHYIKMLKTHFRKKGRSGV